MILGATFDTTEMTPSAPTAMSGKKVKSSPLSTETLVVAVSSEP